MSFNEWVAEYKPVEFEARDDEFGDDRTLTLPEYQVLKRYLRGDNPSLYGYPLEHEAVIYYNYIDIINGKIEPHIFFLGFIVTKKPGRKGDVINFKSDDVDDVLFSANYEFFVPGVTPHSLCQCPECLGDI